MSYEKTIAEIEGLIQNFNQQTAIEVAQNPSLLNDAAKFKMESTYLTRRKETAEQIYRILLTAFEFIEKEAQKHEQENSELRKEIEKLAGQVEHWKTKYQNKIFAND
jgi:uncharacterized membrane protein YgaE (UPF0421/DUF939 family)